ncbi:MAG: NAD(P)/FAD-dependent oxidoreductase [Firmicutes bacterium]|jgi:digeranylgeranylglycerophospholipid reductase|nr:NAD(P)/FAD-dependent oxidoreductase [Bacillota bacterium]
MAQKVAVVGAGPGGLYAAKTAAALGMQVTVFEKKRVGEQIFCAEGFVDILKLLAPPTAGVRFPVKEIILSVLDTFRVDCSKLHLWMLDRQTWQRALAQEAVAAGCELREEHPVSATDLRRLATQFDWIIDASGVNSVAGKAFGLPPVRKAVTAQYTLEGDFSRLVGRLKVALDYRACGYGWVFPKGRNIANVGIGWFGRRPQKVRLKKELDIFLEREGLSSCKVLKETGGPIPIMPRKNFVVGNTLLIGDAAGFSSPLHGGGIDTACISGILAARSIAAGNAQDYVQNVGKLILPRLRLEAKVLKLWEQSDIKTLNNYVSLAFPRDGDGLPAWRRVIAPEAVILQAVLSGRLRADWESGIMLADLPLFPRTVLRKLLAEEAQNDND